jgi:hypothetical protein
MKNSYQIVVDKHQGREQLGRHRLRKEHNIKIHITEITEFYRRPIEASSEHDSEPSGFRDAETFVTMRDFRLPRSCSSGLRSTGMLRNVG